MTEPLPAILVLTRFPVPGRVKTRLIPALGAERAAALHRELGRRTLATARAAAARAACAIEVHHDGGDPDALEAWLGEGVRFEPQAGEDLGRRMEHAVRSALSRGRRPVVLIGTDCPGLESRHLQGAIDALATHDVAIGPARDGGYYLLALRSPVPALFDGVAWGTDRVLARTLEILRDSRRTVHVLEELADIDRPDDLRFLPPSIRPA